MGFWAGKQVMVTGGAGFLGSRVVSKLRQRGCERIFVPRSTVYDLRQVENIRRALQESSPDMVIHLRPAWAVLARIVPILRTFFTTI